MNKNTYFLPETGQIQCVYIGDEIDAMNLLYPDCERVEGASNPDADYVNAGVITPRPTFPLSADKSVIVANGIEEVTFSGFPVGAAFSVSGPSSDRWVETESSVAITANVPGAYRVKVSMFPYLDQSVVINAA